MQEHVNGINEQGLENLAMEIVEYANKANQILNQINLLVDQTSSYFISPEGILYRKKLQEQFMNYQIMCQNILSYANDLVKVKNMYSKKTIDMIDEIIRG